LKKLKLEHILPIGVAVLLPPINVLSHQQDWTFSGEEGLDRWFISTVILWADWYFLFWILKVRFPYKIMLTIISMAVFAIIVASLVHPFLPNTFGEVWFRNDLVFKILAASLLLFLIQYALSSTQKVGKLALEKEQAITESYKSRLMALRTRVDPHFLYNTLNTLRVLVRKKDPNAENFVMNLSQFYRLTLRSRTSVTTTLQEELVTMDAYLFLMNQRMPGNMYFNKNIDDNWFNYHLPTMSLQILIENCLKHNRISSSEPLDINLFVSKKGKLVCTNTLQPKISVIEKSGYGLQNIEKVYELLRVKEGMTIDKTETQFKVTLQLLEDEYINRRR